MTAVLLKRSLRPPAAISAASRICFEPIVEQRLELNLPPLR